MPIGINLHQESKKKISENCFLPEEEQKDEPPKLKIKATLVPIGINRHQASKKKPQENYFLPEEEQNEITGPLPVCIHQNFREKNLYSGSCFVLEVQIGMEQFPKSYSLHNRKPFENLSCFF